MLLNLKEPFEFVVVVCRYPVIALLISTIAPATVAVEGSVTVPVTVPLLIDCAYDGTHMNQRIDRTVRIAVAKFFPFGRQDIPIASDLIGIQYRYWRS